jgi:uncharacterized protein
LITVRVHTRSSQPRIERKGDVFEVWVAAPPTEGRANKSVIEAVAQELGVSVSRVSVRSGARSRTKLIEIAERA